MIRLSSRWRVPDIRATRVSRRARPAFKTGDFTLDRVLAGGYTVACCRRRTRLPQARVAQLVEQRIENPRVGGSNPPPGTTFLR